MDELKPHANETDEDYFDAEEGNYISKNIKEPKIEASSVEDLANKFINKYSTPGKAIFYLTNILSGQKPTDWSKILKLLGYEGVYDPGLGIIHPNEKIQSVMFGTNTIEHITTVKNPVIKIQTKENTFFNEKGYVGWINNFLEVFRTQIGFDNWVKTPEAKKARIEFGRLNNINQNLILRYLMRDFGEVPDPSKSFQGNIQYKSNFKEIYKLILFLNGKKPMENTFISILPMLSRQPKSLVEMIEFLKALPTEEFKRILPKFLSLDLDYAKLSESYGSDKENFNSFRVFLQFLSGKTNDPIVLQAQKISKMIYDLHKIFYKINTKIFNFHE